LTKENINYEVGLARYAELAKGQMLGDDQGLLKLVFDPDSLKLLGVHAIGDRAAEIIHIGQVVLALRASIEYFRDAVFNYPTLAEAHKVAALDGLNKLSPAPTGARFKNLALRSACLSSTTSGATARTCFV
jgi:NAD(P) transhydrogenase